MVAEALSPAVPLSVDVMSPGVPPAPVPPVEMTLPSASTMVEPPLPLSRQARLNPTEPEVFGSRFTRGAVQVGARNLQIRAGAGEARDR